MAAKLLNALYILALATSTAQAQTQKIAIPAFFPLGSDWARIEDAGNAVQLVVANDGNLLNPSDLNAAQAQFARNQARGQMVLGYVDTASTVRPIVDVETEINTWFANYPTQLNGIFLDDGPYFRSQNPVSDTAFRQYYTSLHDWIKTHYPAAKIMLNASLFPNEWIMSVADYVILFEGPYFDPCGHSSYRDKYNAVCPGELPCSAPGWWSNYGDRVSHVIHGVTTPLQMSDVVAKSRSRGRPSLYVYDKVATCPTPQTHFYDHLSTLFEKTSVDVFPPCNRSFVSASVRVADPMRGLSTNPGSCAAPFSTISQAFAHVPPGGTVQVLSGTYGQTTNGESFPLVVPPSVTVIGDETSSNSSVVVVGGSQSSVIIASSGSTIAGLSIRPANSGGATAAIDINSASNVLVRGNRILPLTGTSSAQGIWVHGSSSNVLLFGNDVERNASGLFVYTAGELVVEENAFKNNSNGIHIESGSVDLGSGVGATDSIGANTISCNTATDLYTNESVLAEHNFWDHRPPTVSPEYFDFGYDINDNGNNGALVDDGDAGIAEAACP